MLPKSLIIGASGQVGYQIYKKLAFQNPIGTWFSYKIPEFAFLDITDEEKTSKYIKSINPEIIYICGALTNVDYCEENEEISRKINVNSVKNIVNSTSARIIFFSSDYVFDGFDGNYTEADLTNPQTIYGKHKLEAEQYILRSGNIVIRTSSVIGPDLQRKNFFYRVLDNLKESREVQVAYDQWCSPTFSIDLAGVSIELAFLPGGVYNVAGSSFMNRYKLAKYIAEVFSLKTELIIPIKTNTMRPLNTGLNIEKIETLNYKMSGYKEMVQSMMGLR